MSGRNPNYHSESVHRLPEKSDDEYQGPLVWILLTLFCAYGWFASFGYFFDAAKQYRAEDYPFVMGRMTEYEWVDVGDVGTELVVAYDYTVDRTTYHGSRKRFVWRHFRSQSNEAVALARSWGAGNQIKVFYDPSNPSDSALDILFTRGDWKTLACAVAAFLMTSCISIWAIYRFLAMFLAARQLEVHRATKLRSLGCT